MRADRLISMLLILQKRKRVSSAELAAELGVSVRTIFRDLTALSSNGFPVYAEHGPGGGICIIEEYEGGIKTLTADEVDALQLMKIPESLASLDTGKSLQRAILKMTADLPAREGHSPNLFLDWNWWGHSKDEKSDLLKILYEAVCKRRSLRVTFPLWNRMEFSQEIDPFGIVAKAGEWYLVYAVAGRLRMRRINEFRSVQENGKSFLKPPDFNLETEWKELCREEEKDNYHFQVSLRITLQAVQAFQEFTWDIPYRMIEFSGECGKDGWYDCRLAYENLIAARTHLLGWGSAVEVIAPKALRVSLKDFAEQIQKVYQ